jgi:hypothetical protein
MAATRGQPKDLLLAAELCFDASLPKRAGDELRWGCRLIPAAAAAAAVAEGRVRGFNHPVVLSCAGLLSAAVSTYKYWNT